jgi:hypothetical protein
VKKEPEGQRSRGRQNAQKIITERSGTVRGRADRGVVPAAVTGVFAVVGVAGAGVVAIGTGVVVVTEVTGATGTSNCVREKP